LLASVEDERARVHSILIPWHERAQPIYLLHERASVVIIWIWSNASMRHVYGKLAEPWFRFAWFASLCFACIDLF
jgi:hypothetical protein